ncbi:MAG: lactate racemase domain-containing protein [Planctomycetota bacterium]|nr:lactate racemase domain-containing protein [Planctomycetota bacterium]
MKNLAAYEPRIGTRNLVLQLPENVSELRVSGIAAEQPIDELITKAFDEPIDFPPLPLALIDDDHIAIAIEDGVPDANAIACAVVRYLVEHGTRQEMIIVVLGSDNQDWRDRLVDDLKHQELDGVKVIKHEPTHHDSHGYIAASASADPIYIQRDLVEAEVVLPIYCIRTPDSPSASDKYGMSPSFADATTQHRWNLAWLDDNVHHLHLQEKLSHEVGWLMGIPFAIAVVPASDGSVSAILGGNPDKVFQQASELLRPVGGGSVQEHSLAIAFVEGDWTQQSWMNVARAAAHADMQLNSNGSIVVCTDIKNLSAGISQLGSDESEEKLQRQLLNSDLEDAFAAAVLSSIKSKRSIYLMSQLRVNQVEGLGLAYLDSPLDIERLCREAESVCVMRSSQF